MHSGPNIHFPYRKHRLPVFFLSSISQTRRVFNVSPVLRLLFFPLIRLLRAPHILRAHGIGWAKEVTEWTKHCRGATGPPRPWSGDPPPERRKEAVPPRFVRMYCSRQGLGECRGAAPSPAGEDDPPRTPSVADGIRLISPPECRSSKWNESMPLPGRSALPADLCASAQGKGWGFPEKTSELVFREIPSLFFCPGALL